MLVNNNEVGKYVGFIFQGNTYHKRMTVRLLQHSTPPRLNLLVMFPDYLNFWEILYSKIFNQHYQQNSIETSSHLKSALYINFNITNMTTNILKNTPTRRVICLYFQ